MPKEKNEKVLTCNVAENGSFDCDLNGDKIEINSIKIHNKMSTWEWMKMPEEAQKSYLREKGAMKAHEK